MTITTPKGIPSERALKLKERLLSSPYQIDIERARFYTNVWKKNESLSPCVKAAIALQETLQGMNIRIDEHELLVGVKTFKELAGVIPVERGEFNAIIELELDRLLSRERQPFHITTEERRELEEDIIPWWKGKTVRDRKIELWKREGLYETPRLGLISLFRLAKRAGITQLSGTIRYFTKQGLTRALRKTPQMLKELAGLRPNLALTVFDVQGHVVPGYRRVLELGFKGIAAMAADELKRLSPLDEDYQHRCDFLQAVQIAAEAVCDYSNRYAQLAEKLAETAEPPRRSELEAIAERCRHVPAYPPRNFMEALQSLWTTQVVLCISYGMAEILSMGRVDQYLYPFYQKDLEAELITREQALEVIEEFYVKLGNFLIILADIAKDTASEKGVGSNTITIGGLDRVGNDATNEVSHLFLEAHCNLRALANNLCIRVSPHTPREFLIKACSAYRNTSGHAFFNDEVIVEELVRDGFSLEDARDYSIVGCVEPTSTGNAFACTAGNDISLAAVLEMTLNQGRMLFSGRRSGLSTPDPTRFRSLEDLKQAFRDQLSYNVKKLVKAVELLDQSYAESFPCPLLSSTLEGCLERGRDATRGGAFYNYGSITGRGLGTVVNSLAAMEWAVFDRRVVSMKELMKALHSNFRSREALRQELLYKAPKYGNEDPLTNQLASWVMEVFAEEVRKHPCGRGGFYRPGIFSYGVHVADGLQLGATPDGRLAGEPVSNGISPVNGTEHNGPTAVLRSASLAGRIPLSDGTALNLRLSPALLRSDSGVDRLASLIEGYFTLGGRHVQFNVVDTATLLDAQAHPEKYPDLVIRVSGYCAYFIDLGKAIQDDIIARTEFAEL